MATTVKIEKGPNVNCFVPNCSNKKIVDGNPIHFFRVPEGNEGLRWKVAVNSSRSQHDKRIGILKRTIPPSTLYCCELHFNIETDSITAIDANGTAQCNIKPGIHPSIKPLRSKRLWEVLRADNRGQSLALHCDDSDNDLLQSVEETKDIEPDINECTSFTKEVEPDNDCTSLIYMSTVLCKNFEANNLSSRDHTDQITEFNGEADIKFTPMMPLTMELMRRKSLYYMGLERSLFNRLLHIINSTSNVMTDLLVEMKVMLSLRKERLNEEFEVLGDLFDIEKATAEQYCTESKKWISSLYHSLSSPKISAKSNEGKNPRLTKGQQPIDYDESSSESSEYNEQVGKDSDVVTDDFSDSDSTEDSEDSRSNSFLRDTVECPLCRTRVGRLRLDYHMQNIHLNPLNLNKTVCGLCFEKFRTYRLLRDHQTEVHNGALCMCDVCEKMCSNLSNLKMHIREVHAKERPFLCHLCGASYSTSSKLRVHAQSAHLKVRSYACKLCDKKYYQDNVLKAHIRSVHTKERPFPCRVGCGKSFCRSGVRHTHEQMHKVKYSCEICSKEFSFRHNLRTHCKNIHGRNVIDTEKCKIEIKQ